MFAMNIGCPIVDILDTEGDRVTANRLTPVEVILINYYINIKILSSQKL